MIPLLDYSVVTTYSTASFPSNSIALLCSSHTRTLSNKTPTISCLRDLLIEASLFFCVVGGDLDALPGF
jgi:hypothetical protein